MHSITHLCLAPVRRLQVYARATYAGADEARVAHVTFAIGEAVWCSPSMGWVDWCSGLTSRLHGTLARRRCLRLDSQKCVCCLWWKCLCAQPVYGRWCARSIVSLHPVKSVTEGFKLCWRTGQKLTLKPSFFIHWVTWFYTSVTFVVTLFLFLFFYYTFFVPTSY